jgi:hypothetical protein
MIMCISHGHWDISMITFIHTITFVHMIMFVHMITFIHMIMCTPMITGAYSQSHDLDHHLVTEGVVTQHDSFNLCDHDLLQPGMTHLD